MSKSKSSSKDQHRARSLSRLAAVQAMYQIDILKAQPTNIIEDMKLHRLTATEGENKAADHEDDLADIPYADANHAFFEKVVRAAVDNILEVDEALEKRMAGDWSLARIDSNLRAIMRCAVGELVGLTNVPSRVVLTEYVDIADAFFGSKEKQFLSGVLNAVARDLRPDEFQPG